MSGLSTVMNTAKLAIAAQQYGLSVTGHNIANLNSPHYSRQTIAHSATAPISDGRFWFGTGVDVDSITRSCNQYLENRLSDLKSGMAGYKETAAYMNILEGAFNENTESSLGNVMAGFWNSWNDLSNRPNGVAERVGVYEKGRQIAERFSALSRDLLQIETDLNSETATVIGQVGSLASQVADINNMIAQSDAGIANDLLDKRNALVTELSEFVDINTFEQENGMLSITTALGCLNLVSGAEAYNLYFNEGRIEWEGSYGGNVDITDRLSGGKINGWLEMRDEIVSKYSAELDALAKEFIWTVNAEHSQGVGLEFFDASVTGAYAADSSELLSTLTYGNKIDFTNDFKMWIQDNSTDPPTAAPVTVDISGAAPVASPTIDVSGNANSVLDTYVFKVSPAGGVIGGVADVTVSWQNSITRGSFTVADGDVPTTVEVDGMSITFTAATGPLPQDTFTVTTDGDGTPDENVSSYTLTDFADDFNTAATAAGGGVTASVANERLVFTPDSSDYRFAFGDDGGSGFEDPGLMAALGINTFFTGDDALGMEVNSTVADVDNIAAGKIDSTTGESSVGDNRNAIAISDLKYSSRQIAQWAYGRGSDAVSSAASFSLEEYSHAMIGSLGIRSAGLENSVRHSEDIINTMTVQRDSISAVSLDEEMISLMRYQQAFTAASKLLSVADEMLNVLMQLK